MNSNRVALVLLVVCLVFGAKSCDQQPGPTPEPNPTPAPIDGCPISAEGLHWVVLRKQGQPLSKELLAAISSQDLEDRITELGGTYKVYWTHTPEDAVLPRYRAAVAAMKAEGDTPQLCAVNSSAERFYLGAHPGTPADRDQVLDNLMGAR